LTSYKEHRREYLNNTLKSNFAKHMNEEKHPSLHNRLHGDLTVINKGPMMITVEKFHISKDKVNYTAIFITPRTKSQLTFYKTHLTATKIHIK
jgi:P pilus assembly chaperone PapD